MVRQTAEKTGSEAEKDKIRQIPAHCYAFAECCKVVRSELVPETPECGRGLWRHFQDPLEDLLERCGGPSRDLMERSVVDTVTNAERGLWRTIKRSAREVCGGHRNKRRRVCGGHRHKNRPRMVAPRHPRGGPMRNHLRTQLGRPEALHRAQ